ncbi:DNA-binding MarR family transcriptional regulator [Anaerosolibacter carboniphilus]|uniref:DNA-binding MarR family transcriptional regulator n=1 Tax=Anaerosolibacter carboniphilus TaxID=1417629 RepID=A0A841KVQ0_9FIRM|nr:MarR family transcriptional regulator [Anaerosolibacter carboniphilus]MBB6214269.1 DNA-binding MarR family transcriptional regulator [Anaerosolibacter carboniphilus]
MSDNQPDLYEQFVRLEWLLRRYQLQNYRAYGPMADPHRGQGRVLALLKLKPEISQKELSAILDIRSQSLGELLTKLERSGYITRTPSEADRRVMNIRLTDAGMEAANQNEQQPDNEKLFGCLNEEEQTTLSEYLRRIIDELEQQFGDDELDFRRRGPHDLSPFGGGGFDPRVNMYGGRPPFGGKSYGQGPDRRGGWPDFGDGGYGEHPDRRRKPKDSDKE